MHSDLKGQWPRRKNLHLIFLWDSKHSCECSSQSSTEPTAPWQCLVAVPRTHPVRALKALMSFSFSATSEIQYLWGM